MLQLFLLLSGILQTASAGLLQDTLDTVAENVPYSEDFCFGTGCFEGIANSLVQEVSPIVMIIGTVCIMIAGIKLLTKPSEDEISTARTSVITAAIGIALTVLSANGILFNSLTKIDQNGSGAQQLCSEVLGIISIFEGIAGFLGIIAIAATGIKVLISFGGEDVAGPMRTAVGAFFFGAFILMGKFIVFPALGLSTFSCTLAGGANPRGVVAKLLRIVSEVLGYMEAAAVLILVVLGILLIVYMGNEEQFTKMKSYLYRLAFGLLVIALSKTILDFVILNG